MATTLTPRERQVLDLFMLGQADSQIARELAITTARVGQLKKSALVCLYREYRKTRRTTAANLGIEGNPG